MLQTFYENFGFAGSLIVTSFIFIGFIFWVAGIAGISQLPESKNKNVRLFFSIIFPPYPIIWLFIDMHRQNQMMKEK